MIHTANWMNTKGAYLWCPDWFSNVKISGWINSNELFLCLNKDRKIIGLFLLQDSDNIIWSEYNNRALYIHKLSVHAEYRGNNLSSKILDWIIDYARNKKFDYLRLDCARRKKLLAIYERKGFIKQTSFNMKRQGLPMYYGSRLELKLF